MDEYLIKLRPINIKTASNAGHVIVNINGATLTESVCCLVEAEDGAFSIPTYPLVLEHPEQVSITFTETVQRFEAGGCLPGIYARILAFDLEGGLGGHSFDYKVIIAVWAVLIAMKIYIYIYISINCFFM
jgi:hypothetical protein